METLDRRDADPRVIRATLADLAVSNRLFGGRQAVTWGLRRLLAGRRPGRVTVLDLGAGTGDVVRHVTRRLAPRWRVIPLALDHLSAAARCCTAGGIPAIVGDVWHLPVGPRAVDVVVLSQVLHHVDRTVAPDLLSACAALSRIGMVVADLRRSPLARVGIWAAAYALRFHAATREDGMLSVERGFTKDELAGLCGHAGLPAAVARRPGWRLVAWWQR